MRPIYRVTQLLRGQPDGFPRRIEDGVRLLAQGYVAVLISRDQARAQDALVRARQRKARARATAANRAIYTAPRTADNGYAPHLIGVLGEVATAKALGLPFTDTPEKTGPDRGIDFVLPASASGPYARQSVDVKASSSYVPRLYPHSHRGGMRAAIVLLAVAPPELRDFASAEAIERDVEMHLRGFVWAREVAELEVLDRNDARPSIGTDRLHPASELLAAVGRC